MYDMFYISQNLENDSEYKNLKSKFPILKVASDFATAQKKSLTEFFWVIWNDLIIDDSFEFDYIPKSWNNEYIHSFLNGDSYDGVVLVPKNTPVTTKETEYRFFVKKLDVSIRASVPKKYDIFLIDTYDEYLHAYENSTTELFWATSRNIKIAENFDFSFYFSYDNMYDRHENHAFIHRVDDEESYNGVFLLSTRNKLSKREIEFRFPANRKEWPILASGPIEYEKFKIDTYDEYLEALSKSKTELFWIIPNYVTVETSANFSIYFNHNQKFERNINHAFLNGKYYDGVILCSKYSKFSRREFDYRFIANKVETPMIISSPKPYDVVFISYKEPNADENYARLLSKRPDAKRVHGVVGIHNAHIAAAKLAETDMLWIVDGDALIVDDFNFDYQAPRWDREVVHVWRSKNPINDLIYGYGGLKLFPRTLTIDMDTSKPDMTTSISTKFKSINEVSNITAFNTDPYNTWKSAFRECVKLSSKVIDRQKDDETQNRLRDWCTIGNDRNYGEYAISGAKQGAIYGYSNKNNMEKLKLINDFNWLEEQFKNANI